MKKVKHLLSSAGQTSVEYILLIATIAVISTSLFKTLDKFIISNPDSILNTYLDGLSGVFGASGSGQFKYKRFILRR